MIRLSPFVLVTLSAFNKGCGPGPQGSVNATLKQGEQTVQLVISALNAFRTREDQYPASLQTLVQAGDINQIPQLDDWRGMDEAPIHYEVSKDGTLFVISFGYNATSGFGVGDYEMHSYISDEGMWRTAQDSVPQIANLVAERSGKRLPCNRKLGMLYRRPLKRLPRAV